MIPTHTTIFVVFVVGTLASVTPPPADEPADEPADGVVFSSDIPQANVERLFDASRCPAEPKPACRDTACAGWIHHQPNKSIMQYTCTNEKPTHVLGESQPVIISRCRCCPESLDVICNQDDCAAPKRSHICDAEPLKGCECKAWEGFKNGDGVSRVLAKDGSISGRYSNELRQPSDPRWIMEIITGQNNPNSSGATETPRYKSSRECALTVDAAIGALEQGSFEKPW